MKRRGATRLIRLLEVVVEVEDAVGHRVTRTRVRARTSRRRRVTSDHCVTTRLALPTRSVVTDQDTSGRRRVFVWTVWTVWTVLIAWTVWIA